MQENRRNLSQYSIATQTEFLELSSQKNQRLFGAFSYLHNHASQYVHFFIKTDFNVGQIRLWHFEFGATRFATGIRNINGGKKFTTQSQAHSPVKKTAFVTYEVRIITTVIVSSYVIYIGRI